jgi:ubiquinone/menaquinone biosynthesis C-methylase UbiE
MVTPEQSRSAWDKSAAGYDTGVTPFSMRVAEDALRRIPLDTETRFLDVAAGGGALGIPAARLGAQVLAIDFSPVMVERLNARADGEKLANLEAQVMDGQALQLDDNTFDVSASQFGIMLFPDRQRGLRELARVTKPGGRVLMVVFGPPPAVEIFSLFFGAMRNVVPGFAPPQDSPLFSLQDPETLRKEMAEAGLRDVRVETATHILEVESGAHLWNLLTAATPPVAALVSTLTEDQQVAVQQALDQMLRQRSEQGPAKLNMQVHIGVAAA